MSLDLSTLINNAIHNAIALEVRDQLTPFISQLQCIETDLEQLRSRKPEVDDIDVVDKIANLAGALCSVQRRMDNLDNFDFSDTIEEALNDYDFTPIISEALCEFDFEEKVKDIIQDELTFEVRVS
jgi:hypothetical protein